MDRPTHTYIGRCEGCGVIQAATVDDRGDLRRTAQWVAEMIRDGLIIERVTSEWVRTSGQFGDCTCIRVQEPLL